jgi:hypothetical protein
MKIKSWWSKIVSFTKEIKRWAKALNNPCKKCLVQVTCQRRSTCKSFDDYDSFRELRTGIYTLLFVAGIVFFIISTFLLGLVKWFQILF